MPTFMSAMKHNKLAAAGVGFLTLAAVFVVVQVINSLIPYKPLDVRSYIVKPAVVCAGEPVTAYVTRAYTEEFDTLSLTETWFSVRGVEGVAPQRPVSEHEGTIPDARTNPTDGYETVQSPLITSAPEMPGVYEVHVEAVYRGSRFGAGVLQTVGTSTLTSNMIVVKDCRGDER